MGQIPLGAFEAPTQAAAPLTGSPDLSGDLAASQALGGLGDAIAEVGIHGEKVYRQKQFRDQLNENAIDRANGSVAVVADETQVKEATQGVQNRLANGSIKPEDAAAELQNALPPIKPFDTKDTALGITVNGAFNNNRQGAMLHINSAVNMAKVQQAQDGMGTLVENLNKQVDDPNADMAAITSKIGPDARQVWKDAGVKPALVDSTLDKASDNLWFGHAVAVFNSLKAGDDLDSLIAFHKQLTDTKSDYFKNMSAGNLNSVEASVTNKISQWQNDNANAKGRADAIGEHAIYQMDALDATGVPPSADLLKSWHDATAGTTSEQDYNDRLKNMKDTQDILRKSPQEQMTYVQKLNADLLTNGAGGKNDVTNVKRLTSVVQQNVNQLMNNPLLWSQNRLGTDIPNLDITAIGDPARQSQITAVLQQRAQIITAAAKQTGVTLPMNVLTPQDKQLAINVLQQMDPTKKVAFFAGLWKTSITPQVYHGILSQISPDMPITARAGELAARQTDFTTGSPISWFHDDTQKAFISADVARTMMEGEDLLNPSKAAKAGAGSTAIFPMPHIDVFRTEFKNQVGDSYSASGALYEQKMREVQSYYAGRSQELGTASETKNAKLMKEAILATQGNIVDFGGNGHKVAAPWGMSEHDFMDKSQAALQTATGYLNAKDPSGHAQRDTMAGASLMQLTDKNGGALEGYYGVTVGRTPVHRPDGQALWIHVGN